MITLKMSVIVIILLGTRTIYGQAPAITTFADNGEINWTSPSLIVTCRTEWATSLTSGT